MGSGSHPYDFLFLGLLFESHGFNMPVFWGVVHSFIRAFFGIEDEFFTNMPQKGTMRVDEISWNQFSMSHL